MTSLLVIIVLILLSIALWQLTKIFHLTQVGKQTDDSQIANDKDNNIQGYLMFGFLAFIYIFSIYGLLKWGGLVLANPSSFGRRYRRSRPVHTRCHGLGWPACGSRKRDPRSRIYLSSWCWSVGYLASDGL